MQRGAVAGRVSRTKHRQCTPLWQMGGCLRRLSGERLGFCGLAGGLWRLSRRCGCGIRSDAARTIFLSAVFALLVAEDLGVSGGDGVVKDFLVVFAKAAEARLAGEGERLQVANIGAGKLERVKEEPGAFGVNAAVENGLHDLLNGDLNGVCVLQQGQIESGVGFHAERTADALGATATGARLVMPVTVMRVAHGNSLTDLAVGKNVGTVLFFVVHKMENRAHGAVYPLPLYFRAKI